MKRHLTPVVIIPLMTALAACGTTTSASDAPVREAAAISTSPDLPAVDAESEIGPLGEGPSADLPETGDTPPSDGPLEVGQKSTNVCVDNQSGETLSVTFTKYDTRQRDTSELRNNVTTCAEGTFRLGYDVEGIIRKQTGGPRVTFKAENYMVYPPALGLFNDSGQLHCGGTYWSAESDPNVADDGNLRYTVARLPDTNWKQFRITVTNTQGRDWEVVGCEQAGGA